MGETVGVLERAAPVAGVEWLAASFDPLSPIYFSFLKETRARPNLIATNM
jgi:hypothetical protein